ncbi:MAG: hypothetical protein U1E22_06890 [Coriobacteriia bacterium]|nr:hypothetical protein [Coriobacteriia bacterium]
MLATAAIAAVALLVVFVVPWFAPIRISPIVSDSQSLGFNNRAAVLGLIITCTALVLGAGAWRRPAAQQDAPQFIAHESAASRETRVDRRLVMGFSSATVIMVGVVGMMFGTHPVWDAGYFVARLIGMIGGASPYADLGFPYGPLLLFPVFETWRALSPLGVDVAAVYYTWVALAHVIGLLMLAYLLNRLNMPRYLRNALFSIVALSSVFLFTLGLNLQSSRFLAPYVLLVVALDIVLRHREHWWSHAIPALAVVVCFGVGPEMGSAVCAGLVVALGILAKRFDRRLAVAALLAAAGGAMAFLWFAFPTGSQFSAMASGAFYFPVLPGLPATLFVGTMLVLSWGTSRAGVAGGTPAAYGAGWLAIALLLVAPAFGRADFIHIFWNGLGAILGATAVLSSVSTRTVRMYVAAIALTFVTSTIAWAVVTWVPVVVDSGFRSGVIDRGAARLLARVTGHSSASGDQRYDAAQVAEPTAQEVSALMATGSVSIFGYPQGNLGMQLAESGSLVTLYGTPSDVFTVHQFQATLDDLKHAEYVVLLESEWQFWHSLPAPPPVSPDGAIRDTVSEVGGPMRYGLLLGFPIRLKGQYPTFDASASFRSALTAEWTADRTLGGYVVLRRR